MKHLWICILLSHLLFGVTSAQQRPPKLNKEKDENKRVASVEAKTGLKFVRIPGGSFDMGGKYDDEKPVHRVRLDSYWMSENVVTVSQFRRFTEQSKYEYDWDKHKPPWGWLDNHPMVNVSWNDAKAYCKWVSKETGQTCRLPTEAEWEYAARGGLEGKEYPWGDEFDGSKCANSVSPNDLSGTVPVGSYPANGYGLRDMVGNVWQWCSDWYGSYNSGVADNPQGSSQGEARVLRGGSWGDNDSKYFRCALRSRTTPLFWNLNFGFRPVLLGLR